MSFWNIPVKLKEGGKLPVQRRGDVGFDLFASESVILPPGKVTPVSSGVIMAGELNSEWCVIPEYTSYYYKIEGRSSHAKNGVFPVGGIIDAGYRGELIGLLANLNDHSIEIKAGEKFAQLVCYVVLSSTERTVVRFSEVSEVQQTERGAGGFGSTGK